MNYNLQTHSKKSSSTLLSKVRENYIRKQILDVINIENLTVSYQGKVALDNLSCSIPKGKITGIIGPNGAGKSTLFKAILGLIKVDSGNFLFEDGVDKRDIAYVDQRNAIDLSFPIDVLDTVILGTYPKLGLFHNPGRIETEKALDALKIVKMEPYVKRQIGELSGGQLQRVFIARALAQEAEVFLLDEPFVGIDVVSESLIMETLKMLQKQGKSVAIVHHDLHKVRELFSNVILLNKELVAQGSVDNAFTVENVNKTYSGSLGDVVIKGA
ncbi:iron/zinc/copper transport system ATP-binding protein [Anaerosphaera aminiphila DSM 21120]|uniref:Iron/zinc/copper transport system ATP-binding protein n=1 Tax=Anaerosphaera aminiphila DSM 21120 TaxID=1120995 RepID=A0A1M5UEK6_9FIRM|nr:metal ABC transporter ATP-binding protein [Anaerosphaera aminiphila]SHH61351.1 iron/zinc/copper transport system ATP-binding protein [Anaerosphaera aminiphila DSM 21120]